MFLNLWLLLVILWLVTLLAIMHLFFKVNKESFTDCNGKAEFYYFFPDIKVCLC